MKLLIILPVFLLAALLVWIAADGQRGGARNLPPAETAVDSCTGRESDSRFLRQRQPRRRFLSWKYTETEGEYSSTLGDRTRKTPIVHMLFSGDVYFFQSCIGVYDNAGGIHGVLDDAYRGEIARADLYMANQGFPFSDRGTPAPDKQFTFRIPPERYP